MKKIVKIAAIAALLTTSANLALAQEKVMVGELNWAGAKIIANLIQAVITEKLGGQAGLAPGTNPVIYKAMDRGKGDIDVHPDSWLPNQQNLVDKYVVERKTVRLNKNPYSGVSGYCVPRKFAQKHNIKSIFDLTTPEASKLFDSNGDGKGEFWIGAPGWASTRANSVKVRDYGITAFFEPTTEELAVAYAKAGDAIKKGRGVVFYCWQPHYVFKLYDLVMLEEPAYDKAKYNLIEPSQDKEWFAKSNITTGDPQKRVHVAYSTSLEKRTPEVARFLSNIRLDRDTVSTWTHAVVVLKQKPADVVRKWMKANPARVDKWLGL